MSNRTLERSPMKSWIDELGKIVGRVGFSIGRSSAGMLEIFRGRMLMTSSGRLSFKRKMGASS